MTSGTEPPIVRLEVNGEPVRRRVAPRRLLSDFLRHDLGLTGTHVGCEHGVCGACTVLIDGRTARSCLQLAVQCEGCQVRTIEGLSPDEGGLSPVQEALQQAHGLQCGFCTPGFVVLITALLGEHRDRGELSDSELRTLVSGNLCRCTGYQGIVAAARTLLGGTSEPERARS